MDVSRDSCARGRANVHSQINTIRVVEFSQYSLHLLRQVHHLVRRFHGQLLQLAEMDEWNDHHVPVGIWIGVEDDKTGLAAVNDARLFIFFFRKFAKDTPPGLVRPADVGVAPRRPKVIHRVAG